MTGFSEDTAPFGAKLDKSTFFAWVQAQKGGRFELKDGHIVMHAGSTKTHWIISSRFLAALIRRLDLDTWIAGMADFGVEVGGDIRYPDVLVEPMGASLPDALSTRSAVLLVEVLSPSSVERDMQLKLVEYTSLPALQCYAVASQDAATVWVWQRDLDTGAFPATADEISGMDQEITVRALDIMLPLGEIYRGILKP